MKKSTPFILLLTLVVWSNNSFAQTSSEGYINFVDVFGIRNGTCSSNKMYYRTTNPEQYYKDRFSYWGTLMTIDRFTPNSYLNFDFSGCYDALLALSYELASGKTFKTGKLKKFDDNIKNPDARNLGGIYTDVFSMKAAIGTNISAKSYWKIGGHYRYGLQQSVLDEIYNADDLTFYKNRLGFNHAFGPSAHLCFQKDDGDFRYVWRNTFMYNFLARKGDKGNGFKFESIMHTNKLISYGIYVESSKLSNPQTKWFNFGVTTSIYLRNSSNSDM